MKKIIYLLLPLALMNFSFVRCQSDDSTKDTLGTNPIPSTGQSILSKKEVKQLTDAQMDTLKIIRMVEAIEDDDYPNIHSVLISKEGKTVFERYFKGSDQIWGTPIGVVNHTRGELHDMRSISKSIVSACIGIAIDQGLIDSVGQKVFEFFPEFQQYDKGKKAEITLEHLLTMTAGLKWNENLSYDNPENSEIQMINSPNPVEFVLSRPMEYDSGEQWVYSGGTTQVLASIIKKTSGKELDQFAEEYLFKPLGITVYEWVSFPGTKIPAAASGLRLRSEDLLKFGQLYWKEGSWDGNQLLSMNWVETSLKGHVARPNGGTYGYQFWVWSKNVSGHKIDLAAGIGNGDQRVFIDRGNDLVTVVTAGNYNQFLKKNSLALLKDFIYPALFQ